MTQGNNVQGRIAELYKVKSGKGPVMLKKIRPGEPTVNDMSWYRESMIGIKRQTIKDIQKVSWITLGIQVILFPLTIPVVFTSGSRWIIFPVLCLICIVFTLFNTRRMVNNLMTEIKEIEAYGDQ